MSHSLIAILTFLSASMLAVALGSLAYDYFFRHRLAIRERVNALCELDPGHEVSIFEDRGDFTNSAHAYRDRWRLQWKHMREQAGVELPVATLWLQCIGGGLAAATLGYWRSWWLALICLPCGLILPFIIVVAKRHGRQRKLSRQLPEAFQMISRAVKSGQTIPAALQIIAHDFDAPVSEEFARCYEQQNLGISRETALRDLARRSGIMELQIFVVALLVQAKSGGDLVELLDNLALMIQKRLKLKDRVRALTGEGRMQAIVLTVLPIAAFFGVTVLSPEYAKALLDRPWLLAGTAGAQLLGTMWIRRIVAFEY
jgi:tight adherence protein B